MTEATFATQPQAVAADPTPDEIATQYGNYWGTEEEFVFLLPDGKQSFTIKPLDEGGKVLFQKMTNKGIRVNQRTQDAHLDIDPASERHTLIKHSVVNYNLVVPVVDKVTKQVTGWAPHPFSKQGLEQWLQKANPKIVQELEQFIRRHNPWMEESMTEEQVQEEIDRLIELKKSISERSAGEDVSANK